MNHHCPPAPAPALSPGQALGHITSDHVHSVHISSHHEGEKVLLSYYVCAVLSNASSTWTKLCVPLQQN